MKVALVGNLAGVANEYLVGLRCLGVEADLFLSEFERNNVLPDTQHGAETHIEEAWLKAMPRYVRFNSRNPASLIWRGLTNVVRELPVVVDLLRYDVIHAHTGALAVGLHFKVTFLLLGMKKYIAAATGSDLREVAHLDHGWRGRWMRLFFRRAKRVLLLNVDMVPLARDMGLRDAKFFPFAIDTQRFSPGTVERAYGDRDTLLFFMMSSLDWGKNDWFPGRSSMKENDRALYAFERFVRDHPNSLLVLSDRGPDKDEAKRLVVSLGISDNVRFVSPMSQQQRIEHIRMADVCLDQFGIGAYGLGALEIMACGRPVITHISAEYINACGLESPPILSACTTDEIYASMVAASDSALRDRVGREGREWVLRNHDREVVARLLAALYQDVTDKSIQE